MDRTPDSGKDLSMSSRTTASFPVVHATPAPHALLSEILPRYDIEATACRLHATGVNDVYAITARTGAYFLKVYRAGWRTEPTVRYELDLLRHLRERGVAVASPVPLRDGEMLLILDAPEGRRAAVLYVRARGRPFTHPFCRSASEAAAAGSTLASMHTATDAFSSAYPPHRMDSVLPR